jgi:hypothetical protein
MKSTKAKTGSLHFTAPELSMNNLSDYAFMFVCQIIGVMSNGANYYMVIYRNYLMIKQFPLFVFYVFICCSSIISENLLETDAFMKRLRNILPNDWKVLSVDSNAVIDWLYFSNTVEKCTKIIIYGPNMSGFRYIDKNKKIISENPKIFNESFEFFIVKSIINSNLYNLEKSFVSTFSPFPTNYPELIKNYKDGEIYGRKYSVVLKENESYFKNSPKGTFMAIPIGFEKMNSWPNCFNDLKKELAI